MPHRFLFSGYEQVFNTYPVRTSGNTCISLLLYTSLFTLCRHKQGLQPVSRCGSLLPDELYCHWSRSGMEKYFLTLPAIAPHVSSALQYAYVITAQALPIGQSIRHVCWKLALVVGDSVRYCIVNTIRCCWWERDLGNWLVRLRDDTTINPHFSTPHSTSDTPIFSCYSTFFFPSWNTNLLNSSSLRFLASVSDCKLTYTNRRCTHALRRLTHWPTFHWNRAFTD
jgi:hypothetical protein